MGSKLYFSFCVGGTTITCREIFIFLIAKMLNSLDLEDLTARLTLPLNAITWSTFTVITRMKGRK